MLLPAATPDRSPLLLALPLSPGRPAWVDPVFEQVTRGSGAAPARVVDALAAHLQASAPFVLHVEDWHEGGASQRDFWTTLARTVMRLRGVGLLATSREVPPGFEPLPLSALDPQEAAALLQSEAGAPLPTAALAWIERWACGNPLFTREYFRLLSRRGNLWSDGQVWRWRAPQEPLHPPTVEALVSERLAAPCTAQARRLLDTLALLPPDTPASDVAACAQLTPGEAQAALYTLMAAGILKVGDGDFFHPLYRELHAASLSPDTVRSAARRALTQFTDRPELAAQLVGAADLPDDVAARLLRGAAWLACRRGDLEQAAQHLYGAALRQSGARSAALASRAARWIEPRQQALLISQLQNVTMWYSN